MIDLHSHILPGLDDGAVDLEMSLALARRYIQTGFHCVVATPHAVAGETPAGFAQTVRQATEQLNDALQHRAVALEVLSGMEVTLDPRLPELLAEGAVLTLAAKNHLLVETPFGRLPLGWPKLVFELGSRGVTVLFAHPERCAQIIANPDILQAMVEAGARLQVNWESFKGVYGTKCRRLARHMAAQGLIHCLATDSHDPQWRHPGCVEEMFAELTARVGEANLHRIVVENPARALRGLPMLNMKQKKPPAGSSQTKRWLRWFRDKT